MPLLLPKLTYLSLLEQFSGQINILLAVLPPIFSRGTTTMFRYFHKGDKVEVWRKDDDSGRNSEGLWFPATVLRLSENRNGKIYVEFESLTADGDETSRLREYVAPAEVRPVAPTELHSFFKVGDAVEAFELNAWCKGKVEDILENSKYCVSFGGNKAAEIDQWNLRPHRLWEDGVWIPPVQYQENSSAQEVKSRELKLKIKFNGRKHEPKYANGTIVEVKSDEEGYQGSWYTAAVIGSMTDDKFLVEYQTLKTNDETELLKEEAVISYIRPLPPKSQKIGPYDLHDEVDALYNDGWWEGRISEVVDGSKYRVHFDKFEVNEMVFEHWELRPRQEWVNNTWVAASKKFHCGSKSKELKLKIKLNKTSNPKMSKGAVVEVNSNEEGYQGSWFTAKIIEPIGTDKFLIEFLTLKTEDESQPLRETVESLSVRPCPPEIQRVDRFRPLEEVDAWYNDGWWVGLICRVHGDLKYTVYFWTTNEELEFQHFKLRPHQDWVDGKWILSFRKKKSKLPIKPLLAKTKKGSNGKSMVNIRINVEVESEENGVEGTWYPATSLGPVSNTGKYLIEYKTLTSHDNPYELLKEEIKACNIRPCPPIIQLTDQFKQFSHVDAWHNNAWKSGEIYKVLNASSYSVYFKTIDQVSEIFHCNLRPRMDFVSGKWQTPSSRF